MAKGIDKDRSSVVNQVRVGKVIDGRFVTDVVDDKFMIVPQEVGMSEKADHLLEFNSTIDGKKASILSIDKIEGVENGYRITLPDLSLFKDADGNSIEGLLSEAGLTSQLDIVADENNNLNVQNDNGEIKFTIKAKSGKTYTITTNATGVNIRCEDDGKDYSFQADREAGVGIEMDTKIVEEFLNPEKPFCQVPQSIEDFPSQFFTLYATRQQAINETKQYGDFTINTIAGFWNSQREAAQFPFVFISKKDDPVTHLVLNGSVRRCESFYLQYDEKGVPKIVFKIKKTEGDKTPDYYAFDLKTVDGKLAPESMEAIKRIKDEMKIPLEKENQKSATQPYGDGKSSYEFEHKDSKTYTKNFHVGINDRSLRIETEEAQAGPAKQKRERRIQDTRSHALNTVTMVEKVGDEEHPIMKDGKPWVVKQEVGMSESADHLFNFWQNLEKEPTEEGGTPTTEKTSILTIDKNKESNTYSIAMPNLNLFKDENGNAMPTDIFTIIDGVPTLTVTPPESDLQVVDRKGEMCFTITAKDKKTYIITTNAASVNISCKEDGTTYSYKTENENGVAVDMHTDVISECLDSNNKFCQTPALVKDFPPQLLNLYATRLKGDQMIQMGDFKWTAVDQKFWDKSNAPKNEATRHPFVFLSQESTKETFMVSNGYLRRCQEFYLQYDPATKTPRIVFKLTAIGSENTPQYYAFDLETKDGKLTNESRAAIDTIVALPGMKLQQQTGRNVDDSFGLPFEEKDTKEYSTNFNVQVNNREYNQNGLIETPEDEDEDQDEDDTEVDPIPPEGPGDEDGDTKIVDPGPGNDDDGGNDGDTTIVDPDQPEDDNEGDGDTSTVPRDPSDDADKPKDASINRPDPTGPIAPNNTPEKKKDKIKRKLIKGEQKDYSAIADSFGTAFAYLGVFIAIGALLTGFGILGIIGLAIAGAGTLTTTFSDKFKFTPYKVAMQKVKGFEAQQAEDEEGAENFLSRENDLSKATEQSQMKENSLEGFIATEYGPFKEAYDEYGVGFTNSPTPKGPDGNPTNPSRTSQMVGPDGLHIKQAMLAQLTQIQSARNEEERNKLIEEFMDSNFKAMPTEIRDKTITSMFGPKEPPRPEGMSDEDYRKTPQFESYKKTAIESRQKLGNFITSLRETVSAQEQEHSLQVEQEKIIEKASNNQLRKMICSSRLTPKQRIDMVKRYAPIIARRLAGDENLNQAKLDKMFESLSPEERVEIYTTIQEAGRQVSASIDAIDRDAADNRDLVARAKQASEYIKANGKDFLGVQPELSTKGNNYANGNQVITAIQNLIIDKTIYSHTRSKTPTDFIQHTLGASPEASATKGICSTNDDAVMRLSRASTSLTNYLFENFSDILAPEIHGVSSPNTLLPNLDDILNSGNLGTIENIARQLANKDGDERQKQLATLLDRFKEAKNAVRENGTQVKPAIETLKNILEGKKIIENAGITDKNYQKLVNDQLKEIQNSNYVTSVLTKGMSPEDAATLMRDIATSMVIAKQAKEHPEYDTTPRTSADGRHQYSYDDILAVLQGTIDGTLAQGTIDQTIARSLPGSHIKRDADALTKAAKETKATISRYNATIKLIDKLGLSTIVPRDRNGKPTGKSEKQDFIDRFNAQTLTPGKNMGQVLLEMINTHLSNRRIEPNGPTYSQLLEQCKRGEKVDLKKANTIINKYIARLNRRAEVEAHCNDHNVGAEFVSKELIRKKKAHDKGRAETKYDNIYAMIESIALNKHNKTISQVKEMVTEHPNWSPKKIAEKLGITQKEYKAGLKEVSTRPISDKQKKELWLLQKENELFNNATTDFECAWKDALKGNPTLLKQFVEAAATRRKMTAEQKKKYSKTDLDELSSFYDEILESTGLSLDNLSKLLKGKDPTAIASTLAQLNEREPLEKVQSMIEKREEQFKYTSAKIGAVTKADRLALDTAETAEQFAVDNQNFNAKVKLLESLEGLGFSKDQVAKAYQAFVRGDRKFFATNHVKINGKEMSLETLLQERTENKCSFDGSEPDMLKRLNVKAKDIAKAKAKTRAKNIKKINKRISKLEKQIKDLKKKTEKKVKKTKRSTTANLKKKNPRKVKDALEVLDRQIEAPLKRDAVAVEKDRAEKAAELERQRQLLEEQKRAAQAEAETESEANENKEEGDERE